MMPIVGTTSLANSLLSLTLAPIIAGANSGIGPSIAVALAKQGAAVLLACRNADRGAAAADHIIVQCDGKKQSDGELYHPRFRRPLKRTEDGTQIDMLVHNAGIDAPPHRELNRDQRRPGHPVHNQLLRQLSGNAPSRIIIGLDGHNSIDQLDG
ncbi:uncharacterized protein M421DRAFT_187001 [Didymella exigua CBS 183.55]|uniref:NAD(P)-binding protein n=1 Tax=Didymella exigua CBS 183.55 TaxID=1150837 RepID=A0A6A5RF79_9PLEO|nr:uncharacterized protein M421DRAFT_187001 [Didymella exigua CBS 183.55]KAF1926925.1 hypothetical protein M421DRAFT_187001 [Didymella exigua CBS 183.55]